MFTLQAVIVGLVALATFPPASHGFEAHPLQFDLVFPRNETYAPTQWFPIIFAVQGLQEWSSQMPFALSVDIKTGTLDDEGFGGPDERRADMGYEMVQDRLKELAPGQFFFHVPTVNLTNGTAGDFIVDWRVRIKNGCELSNATGFLPQGSGLGDGWEYYFDYYYKSHKSVFRTATDAPLPDIAATLESCDQLDRSTSSPIEVNSLRGGIDPCPRIKTKVTGTKCGYQSVAQELASNVSDIIMGQMDCKEGDWRTIKAPCPKSAALPLRASVGLAWAMTMLAALSILQLY